MIDIQPNHPNLFIIGAAKSGTTTLFSILDSHPEIFMARVKSTRFFNQDKFFSKGIHWYLDTHFKDAEAYRVRGEATPSYLTSEIVPLRIKKSIPNSDIKFIVVFRNPVDRAYSHYWYNRNSILRNPEELSFEDALEREAQWLLADDHSALDDDHTKYYFHNGQYSYWLKKYLDIFKREQFLFLLNEDLLEKNFQNTVERISRFLGVKNVFLDFTTENRSHKMKAKWLVSLERKMRQQRLIKDAIKNVLPTKVQVKLKGSFKKITLEAMTYPPMKLETQMILLEKYRLGILELEKIIERDLSHWINADENNSPSLL